MNPPCFINMNYDNNTMNSGSHFQPSMTVAENLTLHKLTGGLRSIIGNDWNSPPKLKLSMAADLRQQQPPLFGDHMRLGNIDQLTLDPGFAERAARFSSFDDGSYRQLVNEFGLQNGKVSRVENSMPLQSEVSNGRQEYSTVSDLESNPRKRKAPTKSRGKASNSTANYTEVAAEEASSDGKKRRTENDAVKAKKDDDSNAKPSEAPKDYIHVRARRGQATDSHSLAERVRREKISQRMKLLQDLVPGCNKITGKAVMLDEIINYVQSLQRQVEFLSMKLANVNPQLDFNNLASILAKDMHQTCGPIPSSVFPLETSGIASSSFANQHQEGTSLLSILSNGLDMSQSSLNLLDSSFHQTLNAHRSFVAGFEDTQSQLGSFWEDDLDRVIQMDMAQNPEIPVPSQSFNGSQPAAYMKIEL